MTTPRRIGADPTEAYGDTPYEPEDDDATFAPPKAGELPNMLDELRKVVNEDVIKDPITIPVRSRRDVAIRYNTNLDADIMQAWVRRSTDKRGNQDVMRLCRMAIANQAEQIIFKNVDAFDNDGEPLNFRSRTLFDMVGALDAQSAVNKFFGDDALVITTGTALIDACGYGENIDDLMDPTTTG